MAIPFQMAIQFHELLITLMFAFILFVIGVYLSERIKAKVNEKKIAHGSEEICGACKALIETRKIPKIEHNQEVVRAPGGLFSRLEVGLSRIEGMDARITKLFTLIEGEWQKQISKLEHKLSEKDDLIERLKGGEN